MLVELPDAFQRRERNADADDSPGQRGDEALRRIVDRPGHRIAALHLVRDLADMGEQVIHFHLCRLAPRMDRDVAPGGHDLAVLRLRRIPAWPDIGLRPLEYGERRPRPSEQLPDRVGTRHMQLQHALAFRLQHERRMHRLRGALFIRENERAEADGADRLLQDLAPLLAGFGPRIHQASPPVAWA